MAGKPKNHLYKGLDLPTRKPYYIQNGKLPIFMKKRKKVKQEQQQQQQLLHGTRMSNVASGVYYHLYYFYHTRIRNKK